MKLMKLLILALGLMAISAAASFGQAAFIAHVGHRIIATNAQTGETETIILTSTLGNLQDMGVIPNEHSIFVTYNRPISHLEDIDVSMTFANLFYDGDAYQGATITAYNQWVPIYVDVFGPGEDVQIAEVRVGLVSGQTEYYILQIHFLDDIYFVEGDSIFIKGVRVNAAIGAPGSVVLASITNTEGDVSIDNSTNLEVAELQTPITCKNCTPSITYDVNGQPIISVATLPITELFTNAFETDAQIQIEISDVPENFVFVGIAAVAATGSTEIAASPLLMPYIPPTVPPTPPASCHGNTCWIQITDQNESYLETVTVGLQFALIGIPEFAPGDATVNISLYPAGVLPYPWTKLKYAYDPITCYVDFIVADNVGGKLLSIFNTFYEGAYDTGLAIMNGSGAEPLASPYPQFGSWGLGSLPEYGTVTFYIYPQDTALTNNPASPFIYTTGPGSPGDGLDEFGRVPPKGMYTVTLGQLLKVATSLGIVGGDLHPGETSYFIVIRCNFPSAEGVAYIADWEWSVTAQGYRMVNLRRQDSQDMVWDRIMNPAPPAPPQ